MVKIGRIDGLGTAAVEGDGAARRDLCPRCRHRPVAAHAVVEVAVHKGAVAIDVAYLAAHVEGPLRNFLRGIALKLEVTVQDGY